jgi:ABC-type transport system involved in cytochrome bd biosynthesis fused ATPase/permease subunit
VPLAVGVAIVALVVLVDSGLRDAVAMVVFGRALVLASAAVPVLSALLAANELLRITTTVRPFVELLESARRPELARQNADRPTVPADVVADDLAFAYGKGEPEVLSAVSFRWKKGDALVLAGPNGSGKSTLLRLLVGLRPQTRGALSIGGKSLEAIDLVALRRDVTFLPQRPYLGEPSTAVREVLALAKERATDADLSRALERVGLAVSLDRAVGELSAGQRQRVALARIVLSDRAIVLLDEPDANLDAAGVGMVERLVRDMIAGGKMVAVAAHTADFAELGGCRVDLRADVGPPAHADVSKQTGPDPSNLTFLGGSDDPQALG